MSAGRVQRRFLWMLKHTLNRLTLPLAHAGIGPFCVLRHVGRSSGTVYETPLVLARDGQSFVAELTYGPHVDWYRNATAAGGCVVIVGRREWRIDHIEHCSTDDGLRAFGPPRSLVLRALRRHDFRRLRIIER